MTSEVATCHCYELVIYHLPYFICKGDAMKTGFLGLEYKDLVFAHFV